MTTVTRLERFRVRGGTAAALAALNEVPLEREFVLETDTGLFKFGDGVTAYNALPYRGGGGGVSDAGDVAFDDSAYGATLPDVQTAVDTALLAPKEVYCTLYRPSETVATGTTLWVWRTPEPGVIVDAYAYVVQPATSGVTRINIKNAADSIFSTMPEIQSGEHSSKTGVVGVLRTAPVFFDTDAAIAVGVEAAGSGAKGLVVVIRYTPHPVYRSPGGELMVVAWTQSSVYGGLAATTTNMRDGNSTTGAGTDVTPGAPSSIQADLGSVKSVDRVVLSGGTIAGWGGVAQYLNSAKLQYHNGSSWVDILTISGVTNTTPFEKEFAFTAVSTRYLRIVTVYNSWNLSTSEFRIYGGSP